MSDWSVDAERPTQPLPIRRVMTRRSMIQSTGLMAAAGLLAAACQPAAPAAPATSVPTAAPAAAKPAATSAPAAATAAPAAATVAPAVAPTAAPAASAGVGTGTAVFAYSSPPQRIDPHVATLAGESVIVHNLYDTFFRYSGFPPERKEHLAESFTVSPDGTTYDFKLRQKATFHDGSPITSADALYSFKRVLELGAGPSATWQDIVTPDMLSAPDPQTLRIQLKTPYAPLPDTLAWLYVVNSKLVQSHVVNNDYGKDWLAQNSAGSSAFSLESYQPASRVVMKRYPNYWKGFGAKYLDGWNFEVIREPATVRLALQQGTVSMTDLYTLTVDDLQLAARTPDIVTETNPTLGVICVKMNNQKAPTNNVNFRKAMAYAFNYDAVIQDLLKGQSNRAWGSIPQGFRFAKSFKDTPDAYQTNLDKARTFLSQSGVDVKALGALGYLYNGNDKLQENYGLILKSSLAPLGIDIEMLPVPVAILLERLTTVDTAPNFARIGNTALVLDPDLYLRQYVSSKAWSGGKGQWYSSSFYKNDEVDQLIDQGRLSTDQAKREQMYTRIQDLMYADAPDIWVDQQLWLVDRAAALKGYSYSAFGAKPLMFGEMYFDPPRRS